MASEEYLLGGYTPTPTVQEGGSFKDYAITGNIFGMSAYHPETNTNVDTFADAWNTEDKMAIFNTLTNSQEYSLLNNSHSKEHYDIMKARNAISIEAERRIANDNPVFSFTANTLMGAADPTILLPGTLAFKGSKALVALNRIAFGAAVGATSNVIQENILAGTNARDAQLGSAAFFGATIGGGLFAIGPMLQGTKYVSSKTIAKAFVEPNQIEKALNGELKDVNYNPGDDFITFIDDKTGLQTKLNIAGVGLEPMTIWKEGEVPAMNKFIQHFVISPVSRLARSKYPAFNRIGTMLQSSPIYRTMGDKLFSENKSAADIKQDLTSYKGRALKETIYGFYDAQKAGYKGNYDQYALDVNDAMDNVIYSHLDFAHNKVAEELVVAARARDIGLEQIELKYHKAETDFLKRQLKVGNKEGKIVDLEQRQAEVNRVRQESAKAKADEIAEYLDNFNKSKMSLGNNNYMVRVNETMRELNNKVSLDHLDPNIRKGVEAYQRYNTEYAVRLSSLNMKNSKDLFSNLYKTRVWNLEALRRYTPEQLTAIIHKAFVNHPLNKILIKNKKMKPSTIEKRVTEITDKLKRVELIRDMPDNTLTVPDEMPLGQFLEEKNFNLDDRQLGDLIEKDIRSSMEQYNYKMSGRVALHTMFGTDNLSVIKHEIVGPAIAQAEAMGAPRSETRSLAEDFDVLFEQVLGTHGMPEKPNAWGERATRMLMKWNYLTFGGGFGINALADIGVVAFTNGLGNTLRHFGPALAAVRNMDMQAIKTPWVEQSLAMGALSDFYAARSLSRYDDMDTMFTTDRAEKIMDKGGQVMQTVSGLQHITAIEELMAIGGGTVDIVNTARNFNKTGKLPHGFIERMARYGISMEDLKWVGEQPVEIHNGHLVDFAFDKWDNKQRVTQFQTAITKMMNDAVIRGDKTLLPNYMTSKNPFMRLMTQFMRYPHIAYERVLLRGVSKPDARFLVGTMTSAATMASIYYLREQALIEVGLIKERDAKYAIYDRFGRMDDDAVERLSMVVLMKMPQFGHVPDMIGKAAALTGRTVPGRTYEENPYTAIGGVSASRFETFTKGAKAAFDGEFDGMQGYYMGKSMIWYQNLLQLDQVYNPMIKEMIK